MRFRSVVVFSLVLLISLSISIFFIGDMMVSGGPPKGDGPFCQVQVPGRVETTYGSMAHWVTIDGYVTCEIPETKPPGTKVEVKLTLRMDGMNDMFHTSIFEKGRDTRADYEFTLTLDGSILGGTILPISIYGTWSYLPPNDGSGNIGTFDSSILVTRFVDLQMGITEWDDEIEVFIDQWYDFNIQIYNAGNIDCRFSVWVIDVPDKMQVEIAINQFYLRAFQYVLLECRIKQFGGYPAEETFSLKALTHPNMDVKYEGTFDFRVQSMRGEESKEKTSVVIPIAVGSGFILFFFLMMVVFLLKIRSMNSKREVQNYHLATQEGGNFTPPEGPYT
jgi:hypothetical protein